MLRSFSISKTYKKDYFILKAKPGNEERCLNYLLRKNIFSSDMKINPVLTIVYAGFLFSLIVSFHFFQFAFSNSLFKTFPFTYQDRK